MLKLDSLVLYVRDIEETADFYNTFFDEPFVFISDSFGCLDFKDCSISFKEISSLTPVQCQSDITGGGTEVSFFITGEDQFNKRLQEFKDEIVTNKQKGAQVLSISEEVWGKTFVVLDPDNHRLRFSLIKH